MPLFFPDTDANTGDRLSGNSEVHSVGDISENANIPFDLPHVPTSLRSLYSDDNDDDNYDDFFEDPRDGPWVPSQFSGATPRTVPCTDNSHHLSCGHTVRTRDPRCSTACRWPRWGAKRPVPHDCAECSDMSVEHWLLIMLNQVAIHAQDLQDLRIDHLRMVRGATMARLEELEDALELFMENIRLHAGQELWDWYSCHGREALEARVEEARGIRHRAEREARAQRSRDTMAVSEARREAEIQARLRVEREMEVSSQADLARANTQVRDQFAREQPADGSSTPAAQLVTIPATMSTATAVRLYELNLERLSQEFPEFTIPPRIDPHPGQIQWAAQLGGPAAAAEHLRLTWSEHAQTHPMLIRVDRLCDGDFRILENLPLDCLAQVDRILQAATTLATMTTETAVRIFEHNLERLRQQSPEIFVAPRRELDPAQLEREEDPADLVEELLFTYRGTAARVHLMFGLCSWNPQILESLPLAYLRQLEEMLQHL